MATTQQVCQRLMFHSAYNKQEQQEQSDSEEKSGASQNHLNSIQHNEQKLRRKEFIH